MYPQEFPPPQAQAWQGWPVEWAVPNSVAAGTFGVASKLATVFSCIDLNSRIAASLPIYVKRGNVHLAPGPAWTVNPAPGLYTDWTEAFEQMWWSYQRRGEVFLWALSRYSDGTVRHFAVLNPDHVTVERGPDGYPFYTLLASYDSVDIPDGYTILDNDDVLHIPYAKWPNELRGHSPLEAVAGNIATAYASEYHAGNMARRGGIPWGVLNAPYELADDEVTRLRSQWTDSQATRDGAPAITSGGFTLEGLSVSPREMALLEQREFDEARIAIALGVQPYQVGLAQGGGGLVYQNVSMIFDYHWRSMLRPATRKFASALTAWALPHGQVLHFNPDEYVRGGIDDRAATYAVLHGITDDTGPVVTAAEIRDMEDLTARSSAVEGEAGIIDQEAIFG